MAKITILFDTGEPEEYDVSTKMAIKISNMLYKEDVGIIIDQSDVKRATEEDLEISIEDAKGSGFAIPEREESDDENKIPLQHD